MESIELEKYGIAARHEMEIKLCFSSKLCHSNRESRMYMLEGPQQKRRGVTRSIPFADLSRRVKRVRTDIKSTFSVSEILAKARFAWMGSK